MTKIIASVLTLSLAFTAGVVLGARNNQPKIKKIAALKFQQKKASKVKKTAVKKQVNTATQQVDKRIVSKAKAGTPLQTTYLNKKRKGYTVLLSSFKKEENANNYAKKIAKKGYDAFYFSKEIKGKTWHRVGVGSFSAKSTANSLKKQLLENRLGKGSLITKIPKTKAI